MQMILKNLKTILFKLDDKKKFQKLYDGSDPQSYALQFVTTAEPLLMEPLLRN